MLTRVHESRNTNIFDGKTINRIMMRFPVMFIALCGIAIIGCLLGLGYRKEDISPFIIHSAADARISKFGSQVMQPSSSSSNISKILNKVFLETCNSTKILPEMPINQLPMETPLDPYPIVLLVTFNKYQYYETIPYIELLYRDYFRSILYCGPSKPPEHMIANFRMTYIMFKESDHTIGGAYIYNCTMQAIKMNYDAKGILYMSDDVILKVESLKEYDMDEIWLANHRYGHNDSKTMDLHLASYTDTFHQPKECNMENIALPCNDTPTQKWFVSQNVQILRVYNKFVEKAMAEKSKDDKIFTNFLRSLEDRTGGKKRFYKSIADIYYIPKAYWERFHRLAEVFLKHNLYMEIAVPNILHGIGNIKNQPANLIGFRHYETKFVIPILFLHKDWYSWHPFKLGPMVHGDEDTTKAYCSLFHGRWYRNPRHIK